MFNAANLHVITLRNIGLTRLSTVLGHMAASVKNTDGDGNKILFI